MADDFLLGAQRRVFASDLTSPEKITALALLDHWSRAGNVYPSHGRLATWTSLGRSTVNRALGSLESRGAIRRVREPGRPTRYDLAPLAQLPSERDYPQSGTSPTAGVHYTQSGTELPSERDTKGSIKGPKKEPSCASVPDTPPLALENPISSKSAKAKLKPRRKAKPKQNVEPSSEHKLVVAHYFLTFEKYRGEKPTFDGADGTAVKNLLKKLNGDAERACKAITDGFASWKADTLSIRQIASDPSKFIGAKPRFNGAATRVQNSGTDPLGKSL